MDLFEYQGKQYFAKYNIPVSAGGVAHTVEEAVAEAEKAQYPVVVKAQVQVGGRGKAGGIKLATNADEVRLHAGNILGMDIKGHVVKRVWIEHASDIAEEYYASFTLDRAAKQHLLMLSHKAEWKLKMLLKRSNCNREVAYQSNSLVCRLPLLVKHQLMQRFPRRHSMELPTCS
jgi:succinyl-CoA synthetase beta subunit